MSEIKNSILELKKITQKDNLTALEFEKWMFEAEILISPLFLKQGNKYNDFMFLSQKVLAGLKNPDIHKTYGATRQWEIIKVEILPKLIEVLAFLDYVKDKNLDKIDSSKIDKINHYTSQINDYPKIQKSFQNLCELLSNEEKNIKDLRLWVKKILRVLEDYFGKDSKIHHRFSSDIYEVIPHSIADGLSSRKKNWKKEESIEPLVSLIEHLVEQLLDNPYEKITTPSTEKTDHAYGDSDSIQEVGLSNCNTQALEAFILTIKKSLDKKSLNYFKFCKILYYILISLILILIYDYIYIFGWDYMEPWTFILFTLPIIIGFILNKSINQEVILNHLEERAYNLTYKSSGFSNEDFKKLNIND